MFSKLCRIKLFPKVKYNLFLHFSSALCRLPFENILNSHRTQLICDFDEDYDRSLAAAPQDLSAADCRTLHLVELLWRPKTRRARMMKDGWTTVVKKSTVEDWYSIEDCPQHRSYMNYRLLLPSINTSSSHSFYNHLRNHCSTLAATSEISFHYFCRSSQNGHQVLDTGHCCPRCKWHYFRRRFHAELLAS